MPYTFTSSAFPDSPGVYLMKAEHGEVLYVGKAKSLRKRVSSYFQDAGGHHGGRGEKIRALVAAIGDIETISTNTEREALLLENELIKTHLPPFNVRMKDDKSFPYIMITMEETFPRVEVIRGVHLYPKTNLFFGPYTDKRSVVRILKLLRTIFPFCSCKRCVKHAGRPCLYHHMGQCLAPCAGGDDPAFKARYMANINHVVLFLRGEHARLTGQLQASMEASAKAMAYEQAASFRDKIAALGKMFRPQSVFSIEWKDMDVIATSKNEDEMVILVMEIRDGRLIGKIPFIYDIQNAVNEDDDVIEHFMVEYYHEHKAHFPSAILVSGTGNASLGAMESILEKRSRGAIQRVLAPGGDGHLHDLDTIARKNAFFLLHKRKVNRDLASFDHVEALQELAAAIGLVSPPSVVEGYDISNIQGKFATGSKVCFKDGIPHKSGYRRFRIKSGDTPDDFRMMAEIVGRRFSKVADGREEPPDLIVVDGGQGQLNAARGQLERLGLEHLSIIGLAKREEEIFLPGNPTPLLLDRDSKALLLLQRVRDESHRFAVKYHRQLAERQVDELDDILRSIPSIGEKRAVALRKAFKTLDAIQAASIEELQVVVGSRRAATAIHEHLARGG